jgi:hypothetical protein
MEHTSLKEDENSADKNGYDSDTCPQSCRSTQNETPSNVTEIYEGYLAVTYVSDIINSKNNYYICNKPLKKIWKMLHQQYTEKQKTKRSKATKVSFLQLERIKIFIKNDDDYQPMR